MRLFGSPAGRDNRTSRCVGSSIIWWRLGPHSRQRRHRPLWVGHRSVASQWHPWAGGRPLHVMRLLDPPAGKVSPGHVHVWDHRSSTSATSLRLVESTPRTYCRSKAIDSTFGACLVENDYAAAQELGQMPVAGVARHRESSGHRQSSAGTALGQPSDNLEPPGVGKGGEECEDLAIRRTRLRRGSPSRYCGEGLPPTLLRVSNCQAPRGDVTP